MTGPVIRLYKCEVIYHSHRTRGDTKCQQEGCFDYYQVKVHVFVCMCGRLVYLTILVIDCLVDGDT